MPYAYVSETLGPMPSVTVEVTGEGTAHDLALEMGMSRRSAARAFDRAELTRDGVALTPASRLSAGDRLTVTLGAPRPAPSPDPEEPPAVVLYEDAVLAAFDKPAGLIVHGDGTGSPTLTDRVAATLAREGRAASPQAVQRLDSQTTGVVVFSLAEEFQPALDALVAGQGMRKSYLAEVEGIIESAELTLDAPIGRDRHDAARMRACRPRSGQGKDAVTRVRVLARDTAAGTRGRTLVLAELGTGRRHQIRVHLSAAGHPIVGDALYGGPRDGRGLMLHAWEESFVHPVTRRPLRITAPIPHRFSGWDVQPSRE